MNTVMEAVCGVCNRVRNNSKHGVVFQELLVMLRRGFREQEFDLKLRSERVKKLGCEEFYVNAYYDADDDRSEETPIEVIVYHNFNKETIWDKQHITDFLIQIFDATVHEYKHQRQSFKRKHNVYSNHDKSPYGDYLSDIDEIDAYSVSIAIELCRSLGKHRALRYMSKFHTLGRLKFNGRFVSPQLAAYFGQFKNIKNPIIRSLAKKVYVRLQKIDTDAIFM